MLVIMVVLLMVNATLMGISFSRFSEAYQNNPSDGSGAGVLRFAPELEGGVWSGTFDVPDVKACAGLPFTIKNNSAGISMRVTISVQSDGILPLSYRLFEGEDELALTEDNGRLVATVFMSVDTDSRSFTLIGEWTDDEYDERFNSLSEHIQLRVLCEQWQEE